jgi:hypothetical protein
MATVFARDFAANPEVFLNAVAPFRSPPSRFGANDDRC